MLVSRLHPGPPGLDDLLAARGTAEAVLLPAACVHEVLYGLWRRAEHDERFVAAASWFASTLLGEGGLQVVGLDAAGLVVAGRLRARILIPPSPRRKGQTRPDQRVGWVADIEIAATAWRWHLPLVTLNEGDFAVLADILAEWYPDLPRLETRRPHA